MVSLNANGLFIGRIVRDESYKTQTVGDFVALRDVAPIVVVLVDPAGVVVSTAGIVKREFYRLVCILIYVSNWQNEKRDDRFVGIRGGRDYKKSRIYFVNI